LRIAHLNARRSYNSIPDTVCGVILRDSLKHTIQEILKIELPSGHQVVRDKYQLAKNVRVGRSSFLKEMGESSEYDYKCKCIREKKIMYHAHIGMGSWRSTVEALLQLYNASIASGFQVDRVGICLDRRMALPKEMRMDVPAETGPMLESQQDWQEVGNVVPIQPHMGDFMIGFPASLENTVNALTAGVTTIGNLSQFFAHEAPMWRDHVKTTAETVCAIALMGGLREKGTLVHSYLEDGYGALFYDCATIAGWAMLERYIVETLLGAKLAHCIGGLTTNPVKRAGWIFALNELYDGDCVGSMFYGDTISFSGDLVNNRGLIAEYLMWDILAQLKCPTGHAVLPLPVTEFIRTPSAEEIIEAQKFGHRIEATARRLFPYVDFSSSYEFAEVIVSNGKSVYGNAINGLREAGVDIEDPVQLLFVLKKLGPKLFEAAFGAGREDPSYPGGRQPIAPTDVFEMSKNCLERNRPLFSNTSAKMYLSGRRVLIASTDVHEHAIIILESLLKEAGADVFYLGAEKDTNEILEAVSLRNVDTVLISTHNGMALDYAQRLKKEMDVKSIKIPVIIGGVLNQKFDDHALPVDVSSQLLKLGFRISPQIGNNFVKLMEMPIIQCD
jgi:methylmalonyl-CoA mutase cobalamin-binding subunit